MPVLTAVLPPPFLIWVAAADPNALKTPEVRKKLVDALIFSKIDSYAYFEDVCINLANAILTDNQETHRPLELCALPDFSETSRIPVTILPELWNDVVYLFAKKIVEFPFDDKILAQFTWILGCNAWDTLSFTPAVAPTSVVDNLARQRFTKLFGPEGFAKSCTYKSSGDFVVHSILQAMHISSWRVSTLVQGENVYGPCAAVHGEVANSVIRQYTDSAPSELLVPRRNSPESLKFIIMCVTILEASNEKKSRLLIDRGILRRDHKDVPQPAFTNDAPPFDGKPRFGHVINDTFFTATTAEAGILGYLEAAHEHGVQGIDGLFYAIFDPEQLPISSLLRQYVV